MTAPTELIITKDEAPPENNCNKTIWEAPPKIIRDIPIVSKGVKPISIASTPNIKPNGTTGIINGLTSITPLKKTLRLLFIFKKAFIRSKQYDDPYNVYHFPNSVEVVNFLNRGILIPAKVTGENSLENDDLGTINGNFTKHYPKGSDVQLLLQPEDLEHDDQSNLKLEVVDRKFRGTNFIYTLKTNSDLLIPVFVHSHHIHQHEVDEKFGIKRPIHIDHIVCF